MRECVECVPIIPWSHLVHIVKLMNNLQCYIFFKSVSQFNQSTIKFYLSSLNSQLTIQFHWPPWNPLTSHVLPVWIRTDGPSTPAFQIMTSMTPRSDRHATNQHIWLGRQCHVMVWRPGKDFYADCRTKVIMVAAEWMCDDVHCDS